MSHATLPASPPVDLDAIRAAILKHLEDRPVVEMPAGAAVLTFQLQGRTPIRCSPDRKVERRRFLLVGTGHPIHDPPGAPAGWYVGTVQLDGFVWHLFEDRS